VYDNLVLVLGVQILPFVEFEFWPVPLLCVHFKKSYTKFSLKVFIYKHLVLEMWDLITVDVWNFFYVCAGWNVFCLYWVGQKI
jgi:hypothetical protein